MARALPIFPLPLVVFPGTRQPLHIFEPRYRQLLADCLASDRRFGITYLPPSRDPSPAPAPVPVPVPVPALGDVGCVAAIRSTQQLPDGCSDILAVGERRFVLLGWADEERPYRLARVEEFDDEPVDPAEAGALAAGVRADFTRLARAMGALTDQDGEPAELPADPQSLSFQVAAALELEPGAKRVLQALRSTTTRLRQLAALLGPLASDAERRAVVRQRARGNGRGGAHPRIERAS